MSPAEFRRRVVASHQGARVVLSVPVLPEVQALAFDFGAPVFDRLLAAAAAGVMRRAVVERALAETQELRAAVIRLAAHSPAAEPALSYVTLAVPIGEAVRP